MLGKKAIEKKYIFQLKAKIILITIINLYISNINKWHFHLNINVQHTIVA